eukprot:TRINITY_DN48801_c0_g1_i1.p1 TRINITY_DN48801_c0_g1~~TRINITY_DN48801_c0_g1_i1.p1  ORF type:complete len:141 (-),score=17.51 TRINITY_DN48801_c0_g1_i1:113-535(-)
MSPSEYPKFVDVDAHWLMSSVGAKSTCQTQSSSDVKDFQGDYSASHTWLVKHNGLDHVVDPSARMHEGPSLNGPNCFGCLDLEDVLLRVQRVERARQAKRVRRTEVAKQIRLTLALMKEQTNSATNDDSRSREWPLRISL